MAKQTYSINKKNLSQIKKKKKKELGANLIKIKTYLYFLNMKEYLYRIFNWNYLPTIRKQKTIATWPIQLKKKKLLLFISNNDIYIYQFT